MQHMTRAMSNAAARTPWEHKRDVLFFRGSRTTAARDALVALGQEGKPHLDIQFTKGTSKRSDAARRSKAYPQVHLEDHCQYRCVLAYTG